MNKGMISALIACFFGAALAAACDPSALPMRPFEVVPTLGSGDDLASPGACAAAKTEQACSGALRWVWSGDHCAPMSLSARP